MADPYADDNAQPAGSELEFDDGSVLGLSNEDDKLPSVTDAAIVNEFIAVLARAQAI